jgi:hypothetical protein
VGIHFTNATKQQLIENLALHIEQETVSFPEIPELINELSLYGYEITRAGNITYAAPPGYHDDCVISLALAVSEIRGPQYRGAAFSYDDVQAAFSDEVEPWF